MGIQPTSAYTALSLIANSAQQRRLSGSVTASAASPAANFADSVDISKGAWEAFAASNASPSSSAAHTDKSIEARLAEIKAKDVMSRTQEDQDYLFANDKRLAEITGKPHDKLTADEIDYMQKAGGFVNTMANLSPAEKALYDKAVASGDTAAAAGIGQVAFIRTMGHTAGGAGGTTYDPIGTEINAANIGKFFIHSIVDSSGKAQSNFQALIQFLQNSLAA